MKTHLTERAVKAAKPDPARKTSLNDDAVAGFALRLYPSGRKAFILRYRAGGRERLHTIGDWPDWSVTAAREEARELRRAVDRGEDPQAERAAEREAPLVRDLITRYIEEYLPRLAASNADEQKRLLCGIVAPAWGARKVADIAPADVARLLERIAAGKAPGQRRPAPVRANRAGAALRKMFNFAGVTPNPASQFNARPENAVERFLSDDELSRLGAALEATDNQLAADVVRLSMLTGARSGEVRTARFEQFDLVHGVWTKQSHHTKQRRTHRVPVSDEAMALVRLRREMVGPGCPWLFPSRSRDGRRIQPIGSIRRFWVSVCRDAGLAELVETRGQDGNVKTDRRGRPVMEWRPTVRIHDLRHTFASVLATRGASLSVIGKLLGHTQAKTTERYAHLAGGPLREGVAVVGEVVGRRPRLVAAD